MITFNFYSKSKDTAYVMLANTNIISLTLFVAKAMNNVNNSAQKDQKIRLTLCDLKTLEVVACFKV